MLYTISEWATPVRFAQERRNKTRALHCKNHGRANATREGLLVRMYEFVSLDPPIPPPLHRLLAHLHTKEALLRFLLRESTTSVGSGQNLRTHVRTAAATRFFPLQLFPLDALFFPFHVF